jgi:hypothetical protein
VFSAQPVVVPHLVVRNAADFYIRAFAFDRVVSLSITQRSRRTHPPQNLLFAVSGFNGRTTYELIGPLMTGKFQSRMPGQTEWKSYLEWSGIKR